MTMGQSAAGPDDDVRTTLLAIGRWKETAAAEVDDIGDWRDADPGDRQHLFWSDPARSKDTEHGSTMPRGFYADTAYLLGWVASNHEKLDPTPLQDIYDAVATWHDDHNGDRLPDQSSLVRKLSRAMQVVDAAEGHLRRGEKPAAVGLCEWDADRARLKHLIEAMRRSVVNAGSWSRINGVFERQEEAERLAIKLGFAGAPLRTHLYQQGDPVFARSVGQNPDGLTSVMTYLSFRPLGGLAAGNLGGYRPGTVNGKDVLFEIEFPFQPWKDQTISCLEEWLREIDGMRADGTLPARYPKSAALLQAMGEVSRTSAQYGAVLSMLAEPVKDLPDDPGSPGPAYAPPERCLPPESPEMIAMRAEWESHREKLDQGTRERFRRLDMFLVTRLEADEAAARCEAAADAAADEWGDDVLPASKQLATRVRSLLAGLRQRVGPWHKPGLLMSPDTPLGVPTDPAAEAKAVFELGRGLQGMMAETRPIAEQRRGHATRSEAGNVQADSTQPGQPEGTAAAETPPEQLEYRPATWFKKGASDWLRKAAAKNRKSKRVRARTDDATKVYCVEDVRKWRPDFLPPPQQA